MSHAMHKLIITPGRVWPTTSPRFVLRNHSGSKWGVWDVTANDWASYAGHWCVNWSRRSAQVIANTLNAHQGA